MSLIDWCDSVVFWAVFLGLLWCSERCDLLFLICQMRERPPWSFLALLLLVVLLLLALIGVSDENVQN